MSRGAWAQGLGGLLLIGILRGAIQWKAPFEAHPLDPAEFKLGVAGRLIVGGDWSALSELAQASQNRQHGGWFWSAFGVGLTELVVGPGLLASRLTGLWLSLLAVAAALKLAPRHPLSAVACGLAPVWANAGFAIPWGSHTEAALFPLLWALSARRPAILGLALGAGIAFDLLLLPWAACFLLATLTWPDREQRSTPPKKATFLLTGLVVGVGLVLLPAWALGGGPAFDAPFREAPESHLGKLAADSVRWDLLQGSLGNLGHLPWAAHVPWGDWAPQVGLLHLISLLACARYIPAGPVRHLLGTAVLGHGLCLLVFAPGRPEVALRYLLPTLPLLLLTPAFAYVAGGTARYVAGICLVLGLVAHAPGHLRLLNTPEPGLVAIRGRLPETVQTCGLEAASPRAVLALGALAQARGHGVVATDPTSTLCADPRIMGAITAFSPRWGYPTPGEGRPQERLNANIGHQLRAASPETAWGLGFGMALIIGPSAARARLHSLDLGSSSREAAELGITTAADPQQGLAPPIGDNFPPAG